ncbi:MAG: DUF4143 domain-containing protein [Proteobacteria bacterium]|nr:DUF4143 domain-containing protein [Pseudomonadota bacterium]
MRLRHGGEGFGDHFRHGLAHRLATITDLETLLGHPLCGATWEGFAIEQLLAHLPDTWAASYYRTHAQAEIDLVLADGGTVEIETMHTYRRGPVLQPFAQWCIDLLDGPEQTTDPLRRHLVKGMSRMLIGKLGQRSRKLIPSDVTPPALWGEWTHTPDGGGSAQRMVTIDGQTYTIDTSGEPGATTTDTAYEYTGLTNGVTYFFRVVAANGDGNDGCVIIVQKDGFGQVLGVRRMMFADRAS